VNRLSRQLALLFIPLVLDSLAPAPQARASCQEGCFTIDNTILGDDALPNNNAGSENTAIGSNTLMSNISGSGNTAVGSHALFSSTNSSDNTAMGNQALYSTLQSGANTAVGNQALYSDTTGEQNTATGVSALLSNTTGNYNTATGTSALAFNATGNNNTAVGYQALSNNASGGGNIVLGFQAGMNVTGNSNIDIGNIGVTGESGKIRIGTRPDQKATFIAGIAGVTVPNGVGVIINPQGQLGTVASSARFKIDINPMDKASEVILALKPVTFRYKHDLDPEGIPQFGLVAEEVEKVNPDLVARDEQGKPYTVRYEAVNAMLLNEFLKAHRTIEQQGAMIAQQQKQIEALTAGLQKVNAQLELRKSAAQTVLNNR
jgi:hypothetical protein